MATYKRAHTSLVFAVEKLRSDHPKLARLTLTEVVAENIRRKLWPEFTAFFTGRLPVNTFRENFYLGSEQAKQEKNKQKTYKNSCAPQEVASTLLGEAAGPDEDTAQPEGNTPPSPLTAWLSFLSRSARAPLPSPVDIIQVERHLRDCSWEELNKISNSIKALSMFVDRALKNKRAARRTVKKINEPSLLPLSLESS
jgi:hypothetical protein